MDGEATSVAVVSSRADAEMIAGMLISHGMKAVVSADGAGGQDPEAQQFGVRVLVAKSDEASAREILAAADQTLGSVGQCGGD